MEELRSTEILDKEIQSDARKKAERILQRADSDAKGLLSGVDARIEKSEKEIADKTESMIAAFEKDQEASLPLEKQRFLVSFVQESMEKCVNTYFENLTEDARFEILLKSFKNYEDVLKSKKVNVYTYGFKIDLVKKYLDKVLQVTKYEPTEFNKFIAEDECGLDKKEGIIIESGDGSVRLRLTIPELIHNVLNTYRAELYTALFGGRLEAV